MNKMIKTYMILREVFPRSVACEILLRYAPAKLLEANRFNLNFVEKISKHTYINYYREMLICVEADNVNCFKYWFAKFNKPIIDDSIFDLALLRKSYDIAEIMLDYLPSLIKPCINAVKHRACKIVKLILSRVNIKHQILLCIIDGADDSIFETVYDFAGDINKSDLLLKAYKSGRYKICEIISGKRINKLFDMPLRMAINDVDFPKIRKLLNKGMRLITVKYIGVPSFCELILRGEIKEGPFMCFMEIHKVFAECGAPTHFLQISDTSLNIIFGGDIEKCIYFEYAHLLLAIKLGKRKEALYIMQRVDKHTKITYEYAKKYGMVF